MSYIALLSRLQGHRIKICHEDPQRPGMAAYTAGTLLRCDDTHVVLMNGSKRLAIELKTIDRIELPNPGFERQDGWTRKRPPVSEYQIFEVGDVIGRPSVKVGVAGQKKIMIGWTVRGKSRWLTAGTTHESTAWWPGPSSLPKGWALVEPKKKKET